MPKYVIGLSLLLSLFISLSAQDTLNHIRKYNNTVGLEIAGNSSPSFSPEMFNKLNRWNVSYQRLLRLSSTEKVHVEFRVGYGTRQTFEHFDTNNQYVGISRLHTILVEAGLLFGKRPLKFDLALGYSHEFGKQTFTTYPGSGGSSPWPPVYETVSNYDWFTVRVGIVVTPQNRFHIPFIRLAWMPSYIPRRNPVANPGYGDFAGLRFIPLYGGLTIGAAF